MRRGGVEEHEGKGRTSDGIDAITKKVDRLAKGLSKRLLAGYDSARRRSKLTPTNNEKKMRAVRKLRTTSQIREEKRTK
jgi:hypothetical protein